MRQPSKRPRQLLLALVASLLGLACALLLVEAVVRVFFNEAVQPRYVIDPGYGVRANQPNVRTRHYVPGDYDVAISTNSAGMRGQREYPLERVPGRQRILVLGDSFAFGYGVQDDEVVSAVLEDELNARRPGAAEVINLGVSGFGQAEELVTWEARGRAYRPDIVVMFYFDNDIGNNAVSDLYTLGPDGAPVRTGKAYLPGSRLQERMFAVPPLRWMFEHSQAWNLIRNRLSSLVQRQYLRSHGLAAFDDSTPQAVALTRALLAQFAREVREAGAVPVIFIIPDGRAMTSTFPLTVAEVQALGVTLLDGRGIVAASDYYQHDSHWRASGHRKAADALAAVLEAAPAAGP